MQQVVGDADIKEIKLGRIDGHAAIRGHVVVIQNLSVCHGCHFEETLESVDILDQGFLFDFFFEVKDLR